MRLLVVGDTHHYLPHMRDYIVPIAKKFGVSYIVQLGDFGYWPEWHEGVEFLDGLNEALDEAGIPLGFIRGNHENHDELAQVKPERFSVREWIEYIPDGHSWTWEGVKFLALGGGYSVNKEALLRNEEATGYKQWFPQEGITREQAQLAKRAGKVDVMFTHDCPMGLDLAMMFRMQRGGPDRFVTYHPSEINRRLIREVVEVTRPSRLYHGHYHVAHRTDLEVGTRRVKVEGLAQEGRQQDSWTILDTEDFH